MAQLQAKRLGPEPWGRRLERARARVQFRQIEEILFPHVTKSSVVRLERLEEVPTDRKIRARAAMLVLLYGYDLEDFDLTWADVPPAIDLRVLDRLRRLSTRWICRVDPSSLSVAA